ncbi:hypothetical protein BV394_09850 [Brevirhabdus pacifica]|uniref:Uncharacterized protein n=1 Tax=Brevirhabdus pacifica TaxID=1267768 RepID=A0A1U7DJB9_9RHOB|nr:hypothetical protein [Brevirhabdus pacifica]APX89983.1 hypothetical protein BV394_09850 [Brevirhabdus pacifica]OWU75415.1 hypothetical protein ATO5_12545 [Loktanella sp. 22II-4b]PJJ82780.1 hypothetical protein CLV77_2555 [Brevirhabdus pacifica]
MNSFSPIPAPAFAFAALAHVALSQPAPAQGVAIDPGAVTAACASSGSSCRAIVDGHLARLAAAGLAPADLRSRIALLATAVLQAVTSAPPSRAADLADALASVLVRLADATDDPAQETTLRQVAGAVANGTFDTLPVGVAVAASPR